MFRANRVSVLIFSFPPHCNSWNGNYDQHPYFVYKEAGVVKCLSTQDLYRGTWDYKLGKSELRSILCLSYKLLMVGLYLRQNICEEESLHPWQFNNHSPLFSRLTQGEATAPFLLNSSGSLLSSLLRSSLAAHLPDISRSHHVHGRGARHSGPNCSSMLTCRAIWAHFAICLCPTLLICAIKIMTSSPAFGKTESGQHR